ncbi:MAG: hypothetical protein AB7I29_13445 [Geobacter sp.]
MNQTQLTTVLRDLDSCRSILDVLATLLENNVSVADYHSLAVLAADGRKLIDGVADQISG